MVAGVGRGDGELAQLHRARADGEEGARGAGQFLQLLHHYLAAHEHLGLGGMVGAGLEAGVEHVVRGAHQDAALGSALALGHHRHAEGRLGLHVHVQSRRVLVVGEADDGRHVAVVAGDDQVVAVAEDLPAQRLGDLLGVLGQLLVAGEGLPPAQHMDKEADPAHHREDEQRERDRMHGRHRDILPESSAGRVARMIPRRIGGIK